MFLYDLRDDEEDEINLQGILAISISSVLHHINLTWVISVALSSSHMRINKMLIRNHHILLYTYHCYMIMIVSVVSINEYLALSSLTNFGSFGSFGTN